MSLFNFSCPFAITSLICCEITILFKPIVKSLGNVKFRRHSSKTDFDEIRTLELPPEATHRAKFNLYPTMRVVSANTQFATVTEKLISGVHVSSGTAETVVRRGEIANHHSIAYSLSNISAKNYQNRLMCVEVIVWNISVVF